MTMPVVKEHFSLVKKDKLSMKWKNETLNYSQNIILPVNWRVTHFNSLTKSVIFPCRDRCKNLGTNFLKCKNLKWHQTKFG